MTTSIIRSRDMSTRAIDQAAGSGGPRPFGYAP
jgi:hypothetical protein